MFLLVELEQCVEFWRVPDIFCKKTLEKMLVFNKCVIYYIYKT